MKLILALGNPGSQYDKTRHNTGFFMLDQLASKYGVGFIEKPKFKAQIAEISIGAEKAILAKPSTFYNLSGESARAVADFYKIPSSDILIIHDELMLPLGSVRTRIGGRDAGNNGLKSIAAHIDEGTARIRIGISTDHMMSDTDFVLGKFNSLEQEIINGQLPTVYNIVEDFLNGNFTTTTHRVGE